MHTVLRVVAAVLGAATLIVTGYVVGDDTDRVDELTADLADATGELEVAAADAAEAHAAAELAGIDIDELTDEVGRLSQQVVTLTEDLDTAVQERDDARATLVEVELERDEALDVIENGPPQSVTSPDDAIPFGEAGTTGEWTLVLTDWNTDANMAVARSNRFNDPAPPDHTYVSITATATYNGPDIGTPWLDLDWNALGLQTGVLYEECGVVFDGELGDAPDVVGGGTVSGHVCFTVPADQVDSLMIAVSSDYGAPIHLSLSPTGPGEAEDGDIEPTQDEA